MSAIKLFHVRARLIEEPRQNDLVEHGLVIVDALGTLFPVRNSAARRCVGKR
jgi:hypothetical protein